jgi:RNA polymerase sigma-70 factor (ECF subfamily)
MPPAVLSEEAWLVRVMVNVARDGWRRRATHRRFVEHGGDGTTRQQASSAEAQLVARRTVWWALDQLPPRRRAAIVLYELEGRGMRDIAQLLGISAVTVRWHLSRGRRELARLLGTGNTP